MVLLLLFVAFFITPTIVKADGLDKVPSTTPTPTASPLKEEEERTEDRQNNISNNQYSSQYSSIIERQEVKSGNEKKSSLVPLAVTLFTTGGIGGGYYLYQTKRKRR